MARNQTAQAQGLKNYTSTRTYSLHNGRFHKTAELTVKLTYSYPGRKHFEVLSESGPRPVCDKVLRRMVESEAEVSGDELRQFNRITPENYDFRLVREDRENGRTAYVIETIHQFQVLVEGRNMGRRRGLRHRPDRRAARQEPVLLDSQFAV